ncbi:MAG: thiolase family protein [Polyangia bacterium]|jgi:acetyl-CoA C-acetyltransferase|nr:thiolase family protein [Polyangia bacterium]
MKLNDVVAISAARTPMGRFGGTLKDVPVYDLGAQAIRAALERAGVPGDAVDEVIYGNCRQAGNGVNPARSASRFAGVSDEVPAHTVNMACPSGMKTMMLAAQALMVGDAKLLVCGGMDSMSTIPFLLKNVRWDGFKMGDRKLEDGWSDSVDPVVGFGMGMTAENVAEKYDISRQAMDEFAAESQHRAATAQENGWFDAEVVPVEIPGKGKNPSVQFTRDESIRGDTTVEKLGKLKPAFKPDGGKVTPGNACGMTDGACALVLTTREHAKTLGATPLFSILGYSNTAVNGAFMGEGPGVAIPKALEAAGLGLADMDLLEVNEAFAAQVLCNEKMLGFDRKRLNVHGGAIALGHPTGISGARIVITLLYALRRTGGELGVASICGGSGVSTAMVIRRET